jgi:hypothetical protein
MLERSGRTQGSLRGYNRKVTFFPEMCMAIRAIHRLGGIEVKSGTFVLAAGNWQSNPTSGSHLRICLLRIKSFD